MPDIWYECALFLQQAMQQFAEKGDVKMSQTMLTDVKRYYF